MVVIDPTYHYADELWRARPTFGGWEADAYVHTDLYGPGVGHGGVRAYGGSAVGGLIRADELAAGTIPHVLALALTRDHMRYGPVWPAIFEDSFNPFSPYAGNVPMGSLVALPRFLNIDALGFSPATTAIARAAGLRRLRRRLFCELHVLRRTVGRSVHWPRAQRLRAAAITAELRHR